MVTNETNKRMVEMVRKLTTDLTDLIKSDKEHQRKYGFENSHTILGYNRAILMVEEFGPELISEAMVSETNQLRSLIEREVKEGGSTNVSPTASPMEVDCIDEFKDELYCRFAGCPNPKCDNGNIIEGSNYCNKCGQKLIWPTEDEKKEEVKHIVIQGHSDGSREVYENGVRIELLKCAEGSVKDD